MSVYNYTVYSLIDTERHFICNADKLNYILISKMYITFKRTLCV